jgi:hypothetical protein
MSDCRSPDPLAGSAGGRTERRPTGETLDLDAAGRVDVVDVVQALQVDAVAVP